MQSRLNMSDYEKIIFVDKIDENELKNSGESIEELSNSYPFAVFFTNYKGEDGETQNQTVHNIWQGGNRLTKFVGIDPKRNKIKINDHILKLKFYYDTGLLGIEDANQLESIKLVDVQYTDLLGNTFTNYIEGMETLIDSIDNKFTLVFDFVFKGTPDEDVNVLNISPLLTISSSTSDNYFKILSSPTLIDVSSDKKTARYSYNCLIEYDTDYMIWDAGNTSYSNYNAFSQYDEDIIENFDLRLRINPTDYDIIDKRNNLKIQNNSTLTLNDNRLYNFSISLKPTKGDLYTYPTSYTNRNLKLIVSCNNNDYVTVPSEDISIDGDVVNFSINVLDIGINNNNATAKITLMIKQVTDTSENILSNLNKSFTILLSGETVTSLFYCGYNDPTVSNFDTSKLIDISSLIENETYALLYDWKTTNISDDTTKYFYIAYAQSLEGSIIPCWDEYINDNRGKKYTSAANRFTLLNTHPTLCGIKFNILKCKDEFKGLFYGKIQVQ